MDPNLTTQEESGLVQPAQENPQELFEALQSIETV
ncbi:hypothetical protein KIPB_012739, partial [Kipferlia bialata]|eukprot:g12739.t1